MGSSGPNPWAPYDSYKDCSLGICSVYCPQWCYIFPPPPPDDPGDGSGGTYFSPLVIAVIGILASAFLLVSYYTIITKYCRRRRGDNYTLDFADSSTRDHQMNNGSWQNAATGGLDEVVIKSIAVFKYKKDDHLVEGTDCSVCLSEFQEDESLRLLPKCTHAFHLPCIDTWLKSHSSCPLCRSNIASPYHDPSPMTLIPQDRVPAQEAPRVSNDVEAPTSQHRDETVLEIQDDLRIEDHDEAAASNGGAASKSPFRTPRTTEDMETEIDEDGAQRMRRSVSLNSGLSQGRVPVADTLRDCEDNVDDRLDGILVEDVQVAMGIGPSKPLSGEDSDSNHTTRDTPQIERSPPEMKRSISTGRPMFGRYGRGKNFI